MRGRTELRYAQALQTWPLAALLAAFGVVYLASILWLGAFVYIAELPTPASRLPALPSPAGLLAYSITATGATAPALTRGTCRWPATRAARDAPRNVQGGFA